MINDTPSAEFAGAIVLALVLCMAAFIIGYLLGALT